MDRKDISRRDLFRAASLTALSLTSVGKALYGQPSTSTPKYQIGAYYFPGFHPDPRVSEDHGPGWTEWELLKRAEPKFPGHRQPKVPLWGYEDESKPDVFARKIDAAADHGLNHFLFDWYWYNGPYLNGALDSGYLQAPNNRHLKFALMWANHDWFDIQPAKLHGPGTLLHPGTVNRETFEALTDHVIERYFKHASYWTIDGKPYFSIYELYRLVDGLGGPQATREALDRFRAKCTNAGFPGLHVNAVTWGVQILPGEQKIKNIRQLGAVLGLDSVTSYVWIHHVKLPDFPETPYAYALEKMQNYWSEIGAEAGLPYFPNVTMGWDSSPRTCQSDYFINRSYPFVPTLSNNTPAAFEAALDAARRHLDQNPSARGILTINAWNEWTEGSYLEPDAVNGMAYLDAIKRVFAS
jgi:Glycosyltransferase WbsX